MSQFDVIIIGGSNAGLSTALTLGRSLRSVLVIDNGLPCNAQTPHSHNFLTQDGKTPAELAALAKADVSKYNTVEFLYDTALKAINYEKHIEVGTEKHGTFTAKKLVLATGIKDVLPTIPGFKECWGISVVHCPFCHGYEIRSKPTALLAKGEMAMHMAGMIHHLTHNLILLTDGEGDLNENQLAKLKKHHIEVVNHKIDSLTHTAGQIENVVFTNGDEIAIEALYAKVPFTLPIGILNALGCSLDENGFIAVDEMQKTTNPNVFACGDNSSRLRSVAHAVASGNKAGAVIHMELVHESF
ncbi:NAD(P)/FAD-dependent oxidoreductase [Flavobacterium sp. ASW18X]|uniref:NAD(P)/FAD-dependent oxidoreductase n=1 Tax=Flavobacterium sp. ASW18X TaxID=2572595 RepID=UPI0010AED673|nr:NAD(P)/FAD-dependent oxidoreductase [Flavobacterium sp. ASW18X]TKD66788.1 NAD(P)/FAD-dependent oxidoreductase [Flavobacterium sp. ASW18X]